MSDKSLEDFFAKKDKNKKSKSKTKFAKSTTEEIAKRLTEADLKKERKEKEKEKPPPPPKEPEDKSKPKDIIGDEDDWRENEEEKEKDYSGLKIQLQISTNPDQDVEEEDEEELDENGEPVRSKGNVQSGPWNKLEPDDKETEPAPPPKAVELPVSLPPKAVVGGKYVPPSMRGQASGKSTAPSRLTNRSRTAPKISDEQEFPSLAASSDIAKHTDKNSDKNFEKVTRGGPSMTNTGSQGPQLDLENRFAALEQN